MTVRWCLRTQAILIACTVTPPHVKALLRSGHIVAVIAIIPGVLHAKLSCHKFVAIFKARLKGKRNRCKDNRSLTRNCLDPWRDHHGTIHHLLSNIWWSASHQKKYIPSPVYCFCKRFPSGDDVIYTLSPQQKTTKQPGWFSLSALNLAQFLRLQANHWEKLKSWDLDF